MTKILLVDDDQNIIISVGFCLENAGYDVITAANGQEGMNQLNIVRDINLVISDFNMPVMDGLKFCRSIKGSSDYSAVPVLMLSGSFPNGTKQVIFQGGPDAFLEKPCEPDDLLQRIGELLQK